MSRVTRRDRHRMKRQTAALGDVLLRIRDTLQFIDFAEAARVYAQQVERSVSAMNYATTLKLLAELKLADMVDAGQKAGQIAAPGGDRQTIARPPGNGSTESLKDIGVQSQRLTEARLIRDTYGEPDIREAAATATENNRELSRTTLVREAKEKKREEKRDDNRALVREAPRLADVTERFAAIVLDPPWDWGDEGDADQLGRARPTYATMPIAEIDGQPNSNEHLTDGFSWRKAKR